jgi:hypothetical protein
MANDRRGIKHQRKLNVRTPRFPRILILTEGESTEVIYFESIKKRIDKQFQDQLIVEKIDLIVSGQGKSTTKLVEIAEKLKAKTDYQAIWLVFDKDSFTDFDHAIDLAAKKDMMVAWSNPSFEFWFLLHFETLTVPIDNTLLLDKLLKHLPTYKKSASIEFDDLEVHFTKAIQRANRLKQRYQEENVHRPSAQNPYTRVHVLLEMLEPYIL